MTVDVKVLIVEDNNFVRMQLARFLTEAGYEVVEATDGGDALGKVDKTISLAVVDVRMEPIGGFEFIRRIRGMDVDFGIILVTGDQNPDLLAEAGKWNITAVLIKPVQRERLIKAVERVLQQRNKVNSR